MDVVVLKLYNLETSLSIELLPSQYCYYATMEPALFQDHFEKKFKSIFEEFKSLSQTNEEKRRNERMRSE